MENFDVTNIDAVMKDLDTDVLMGYAIEYGTAIIGSLLIFFIGKLVAKAITSFARKVMEKRNVDPTITSFLANIIYGVLFTMVIIAAIGTLGIETTSIAAVIAAAGLAIGMALQGSLSNFAAGVMIIAFRPFKVGDYVEAAGIAGTVEEVNIFTTYMKTPDNKEIIVPNGSIISDSITNYSAKPTRRVDLVIGVGYDDDLKKVKQVLTEIVAADSRVLNEPETLIAVSNLGESSVDFVVRPWVESADYWPVKFDLLEAIKLRLDAEGISIPFPQRDLHVITGKL